MMTFRYITNLTYPSSYANRLQVIKMAEAFARKSDFKLFVKDIGYSRDEIFRSYSVSNPFPIQEIGCASRYLWPKSFWAALRLRSIIYAEQSNAVFFIRDLLLAFFLIFVSKRFRKKFYFECHSLGKFPHILYSVVFKKARGVISTNTMKKNIIIDNYGISGTKIFVAPNGFDDSLFRNLISQTESRKKIGLELGNKIVMYVGSMQAWKGVGIIPRLAKKHQGILFIIVGADKDRAEENLLYISKKSHREIPLYMRASDILIAPYITDSERSQLYFSPIKLFEYMASGVPIVVTDSIAIREVAGDKEVYFASSSDVDALSKCIERIFGESSVAMQRAEAARYRSTYFSWSMRAEKVLQFMNS